MGALSARCIALVRLTAWRFVAGGLAGLAAYAAVAELLLGHVWPGKR